MKFKTMANIFIIIMCFSIRHESLSKIYSQNRNEWWEQNPLAASHAWHLSHDAVAMSLHSDIACYQSKPGPAWVANIDVI